MAHGHGTRRSAPDSARPSQGLSEIGSREECAWPSHRRESVSCGGAALAVAEARCSAGFFCPKRGRVRAGHDSIGIKNGRRPASSGRQAGRYACGLHNGDFRSHQRLMFAGEGAIDRTVAERAIEIYVSRSARTSALDIIGAPSWMPRGPAESCKGGEGSEEGS